MSDFEIYLIFALSKIGYVLLFYPVVFLVFKKLRKESLPAAGHVLGFLSTWVFVVVPSFLLGQDFYEWYPIAPLIVPTISAVFGVVIAFSRYGEKQAQTPQNKLKKTDQTTKEKDKKKVESSVQLDEELFALAWDEIENQTVNKGLWARAFADAGGDSEKTKSIYLGLRVQQLDYERAPLTGHEGTE